MDQPDDDFWPIIHRYTRADALRDGVLRDVSALAKEVGFKYPVALTAAVWSQYVAVPDGRFFDREEARLWDILWMLRVAIAAHPPGKRQLNFQLYVVTDVEKDAELVTLKAECGPGDDAAPVLTVMLPRED